ncbi:glycosyltransferase [Klebsiella sp. I138]|uniref:glycosyltransferase n=1 Tax=Klebsiella sp. I138 TaxID=2755385 RepID=UPI003DA83F82
MTNTISVYIPTHNRPVMLARALESLLSQTYKNFQVLVCNDGSSKSYKEVIENYRDLFCDFKYIENPSPMGACFSRNKLIEIADGEYITGLDDDDEYLPTRLEDFVTSTYLEKYAYLSAGHITKTSQGKFKQKIDERVITLDALLSKNIVGNQVFTKTVFLKKSGGFDEKLPAWQDYDAWVNLTQKIGNGFRLEKYNYQWNTDHEEGRISNSLKAELGYELFIKKHKDILSKENLKSLFIQDKINRNVDIGFGDIINNFSVSILASVCKYKLKQKFPDIKEKIYKASK